MTTTGTQLFEMICKQDAIRIEEKEYRFAPPRMWRFDYVISKDKKIAVEVEGAVWKGKKGGHTSGKGYIANCEKYNYAEILGWCVIRLTTEMLLDNTGINQLKEALLIRPRQ